LDFWDLTRLLWRRWYVSVPMLMIAIGATVYAEQTIKPDYVVTSYVQLIPPTAVEVDKDDPKAKPQPRNPWFDLGLGSLSKAAIITVQDQTVLDQLEASGHSINFTATFDTQMPVVTFEVIGDTESQATDSTEAIVDKFAASVNSLQNAYGVTGSNSITTRRLDRGDNVKESTSKVKRALVAIGGAGILLSVGVTVAVDAWLRRRSRRKSPAGEKPTPSAPGVARIVVAPPPTSGDYRSAAAHNDANATQVIRPKITGAAKKTPAPARENVGEETAVLSPAQRDATIVLPSASDVQAASRKNGSRRPGP
jgi:hypothetical protein